MLPKIVIDHTGSEDAEWQPRGTVSNKKSSGQKHQQFVEVSDKARKLAKIFNGVIKSESNFSICKGQFSIRFNCQNEHNFYLTADQINKLDLDQVKLSYKKYRLHLQRIFENKEGE